MGVLLGFFLCGLINNVYYVVILSAAKSILPGDDAEGRPAYSSLLLAADTPALLAQFCGPMLLYFSFKSRVLCVSVLNAAALLIVASADSIAVRCCGVLLASLCFGLGESACLSALSAFDPSVILNLARQNIPLAFRESAMGLVLTATTAGPILAALLGMALEGALVP